MAGFEVRVEELTKSYSAGPGGSLEVLRGVSFSVPAGSTAAVMGPSGSGKSTLLHLIGAMDSVDSGNIHVGDTDVHALTRREQASYRRRIGFVFQRFHLLPAMTVLDNVIAPVLPFKTPYGKQGRARKLLQAVGIPEKADSVPARLSGGQQQRVAIARALINSPGLLLADEPTGNLDSATGREVLDLLLGLGERRGMTVILATHDTQVAERCDTIISLRDGRIVGS
jgi:putative ABC transport system ATP-binding protein